MEGEFEDWFAYALAEADEAGQARLLAMRGELKRPWRRAWAIARRNRPFAESPPRVMTFRTSTVETQTDGSQVENMTIERFTAAGGSRRVLDREAFSRIVRNARPVATARVPTAVAVGAAPRESRRAAPGRYRGSRRSPPSGSADDDGGEPESDIDAAWAIRLRDRLPFVWRFADARCRWHERREGIS
jgi:hypothetical protein